MTRAGQHQCCEDSAEAPGEAEKKVHFYKETKKCHIEREARHLKCIKRKKGGEHGINPKQRISFLAVRIFFLAVNTLH